MEGQANQRIGRYVTSTFGGEVVRAYLPRPLPPDPPVNLSGMQLLVEQANQSLGRLDGLSSLLPDLDLFIYGYVRKEAVLSSQIEGTQSSLSDLMLYETEAAPGVPLQDVREVSHYVAALNHGLKRLREGFPLSMRLIREIHAVLLASGRGSAKEPGEFRRSQNWIGGTRPGNAAYVPPPPEYVQECLGDLEKFLHAEPANVAPLIRTGMAHVQFETIHPFLDGNGRLGRLLITFLLCSSGSLREPTLYLSLFFKTHRQTYYDLLTRVREKGDWESWIEFFLTGVKETAEQAVSAALRTLTVLEADRKRIEALGRPSGSALRVFHYAKTNPILSIQNASKALGISFPTVTIAIQHLEKLGVLHELTGRQRGRLFVYGKYLAILSEGTEPLS